MQCSCKFLYFFLQFVIFAYPYSVQYDKGDQLKYVFNFLFDSNYY